METTLQELLNKLYSLHSLGVKYQLESITQLLKSIGNPEKKLKCFHIAGSNGKGSTASFISSILTEAGYKVGLYTSPHFIHFNERIKVNGVNISDKQIEEFLTKHYDKIFNGKNTFFEVTTALAFDYFYSSKVDFAVIETGLGGRLDATNVINPLASVITSIHLEHTNILGDTVEKIANEKGGIIKPNSLLFLGNLPSNIIDTFVEKANSLNTESFILDEYINDRGSELEFYSAELYLGSLKPALKGHFQKYNAALACLVVYKTLDIYNENLFKKGLQNVVLNSGIQGRYELVHSDPVIILDSAHNADGLKILLEEFKKDKKQYDNVYLLFSALNDKDYRTMLSYCKGIFNTIYLAEIKNERGLSLDELDSIAKELNVDHELVPNLKDFLDTYMSNDSKDCLLVAGSMYLIGEVKTFFKKKFSQSSGDIDSKFNKIINKGK